MEIGNIRDTFLNRSSSKNLFLFFLWLPMFNSKPNGYCLDIKCEAIKTGDVFHFLLLGSGKNENELEQSRCLENRCFLHPCFKTWLS